MEKLKIKTSDAGGGNMERVRIKTSSTGSNKVVESNRVFTRNGHSPYIGADTSTWWVFDDKKQEYVDTGINAEAPVIIVDPELSEESENPVQNKAVTKEVHAKVDEDDMKLLKVIDIDMLWENA